MSSNLQRVHKHIRGLLAQAFLPLTVMVMLLALQFHDPLFRVRLRDLAFDQLQKLYPARYSEEIPVRAVVIDDPSLAAVGQWPWPRTVLAQIVDQLQQMGARVVVLDVILAEADRTSPEQVKQFWPDNPQLDAVLKDYPRHDDILAATLARSRVVTGVMAGNTYSPQVLPARHVEITSTGGEARAWLQGWSGGAGFLPEFAAAGVGAGVLTIVPDHDGILRSLPVLSMLGGELYPSLGLEAVRVYLGSRDVTVKVTPTADTGPLQLPAIAGVALGESAFFPTSGDARVWLHTRPQTTERYVSAIDVLTNRVEPRRIKDHIVLIGATSSGLGDIVRNPLGEAVPGLEGHLQLMEQLLSNEYLLRPPWENALVTAIFVTFTLSLAVLLAYVRPAWSVGMLVASLIGLFALSNWLFVKEHLFLDPLFPAMSLVVLFLTLAVPRYLRTERDQRWIQTAFSRYVSPNRVKYLQAHPEALTLGGEYRECSFVMTDLAGFTAMMETYEPAMLSSLLNEYLNGMIEVAFAHEGTLDRIVGDAVAVMFSAPVVQSDHAERAIACALAMDKFAQDFSLRQQARGIPFGKTRIGVNTGDVLVGNFGGKVMLDYRALGDAINTAARLETINGHLGTRISVSESSAKRSKGFLGRPAGRLVLKGKKYPVTVFEPLTEEEDKSDRIAKYRTAYALMDAEAEGASQAFMALQGQYPDDPLARYHAQRFSAGEKGSLVIMTQK